MFGSLFDLPESILIVALVLVLVVCVIGDYYHHKSTTKFFQQTLPNFINQSSKETTDQKTALQVISVQQTQTQQLMDANTELVDILKQQSELFRSVLTDLTACQASLTEILNELQKETGKTNVS